MASGQAQNRKIHIKFARLLQSEYLPRLFRRWFDFILFNIDSGHENYSGELPLFERYYIN
jgi:hypothetical protein